MIREEIVIKPKLSKIRITVATDRETFKFRSEEERDEHIEDCRLVAAAARKIDQRNTLRGKYTPGFNRVTFQGGSKSNRQTFTIIKPNSKDMNPRHVAILFTLIVATAVALYIVTF